MTFTAENVDGLKFHHLTIIRRVPRLAGVKNRITKVLARCDCGSEREYFLSNIKNGNSKSCGCPDFAITRTCGLSAFVRENNAWKNMRQRCLNPNNAYYAEYGGRGITVCERWLNFESFLADMGECPDGLALGRHKNDDDYTPETCAWVDRKTLLKNRRPPRRGEPER